MPESKLAHHVPLSAMASVLSLIDELPDGTTGALHFGEDSVVLVENNAVCWATSPQTRRRLTDLLRHQTNPPLPRTTLEALYLACRHNGQPLGEQLVSSGLVTANGLRASLKQHNAEALALIAFCANEPHRFIPHKLSRYDARFSFSTTELLARMAEERYPEEGQVARAVLRSRLEPGTPALVLKREPGTATALPLSLRGCPRLRLRDASVLSQWTQETLDVCGAVDAGTRVVSGTVRDEQTALAWHEAGLVFVALCTSRLKLARCLSRMHTQQLPDLTSHGHDRMFG